MKNEGNKNVFLRRMWNENYEIYREKWKNIRYM